MRGLMSFYDEQCAREFSFLEAQMGRFFAEVVVDCPYHLPHDAKYYQALFSPLSERIMELYLASGYRRNGNCLYTMHCPDCSACIPIRLHTEELRKNRNQRRVLKKNLDLEVEYAPIDATAENVALCEKFLRERYSQKNNDARAYYDGFFCNKIISGMEIRYRLEGRLIGNGIVDVGQNWMNAVYFYFDPAEAARSLGTFNILTLQQTCLKLDIPYLYLGYYIEEVAAMNYKSRFNPHYLYIDGGWHKRDR